ncbi:tyrosine-type recombinase/integrase [Thermodesulfobacteriota bacterium]
MKPFKSFLARQFEHYIRYRQNMGYAIKTLRAHLRQFDRCLVKHRCGPDGLQPSFFLQLQHSLPLEPRSINRMFSTMRMFFQYQQRTGASEQNPLRDIPALPEWHYMPFVFSPEQTDQLLDSFCKKLRKDPAGFLKDYGIYLALLLMARSGLRISEPLRLFRSHYRPEEKTLYIEKTKFKKDRLIPIPKAAATEIDNYLQLRNCLIDDDRNPYLLLGLNNKGLSQDRVRTAFHRCVRDIGLSASRKTMANTTFGSPTPHSLRHSFAINTLKRVKLQGKCPQNALPVLAAYMGHSEYKHTFKYLKVLDAEHRQGLVQFVTSHGAL